MGLMSFMKEAGEKLFGGSSAQAAAPAADPAAANQAAADAIVTYIRAQNLDADNLNVQFDGASSSVTVSGQAADQETKEKILLCCGNVAGVDKVNDELTVAAASAEAKYYTVAKGDTLSKIAKEFYGNANLYNKIFEANRPMLSHPDKIYPGQTLRIPPQ
ncbi:MAG: peptidoglycan-binding protein LysM [Lautropia sp.]|nr:peptidoglycan-binding protein LysM [Lautropia sp.]